MPFKTKTIVLVTFLLGTAVGVTAGWILRDRRVAGSDERSGIETISNSRQGAPNRWTTTASVNRGVGNPAESPFAAAQRLLQQRFTIHDDAGLEFAKYQFQQFLMLCSESESQQLLGFLLTDDSAPEQSQESTPSDDSWCQMVLNRLAAVNPTTCWKNLEACAEVGVRGVAHNPYFFQILLSTMSPNDVQQAITVLPAELKQEIMNAWLLFRAEADPEGVLQQLASEKSLGIHPFDGDEHGFAELLSKVANVAPEKALEAANLIESEESRAELRSGILNDWMMGDPVEAGKYAVQQRDVKWINDCLDRNASAINLDQLRDVLPSLKSEHRWDLANLAERITTELAKSDLAATKAWAASLPAIQQQAANGAVLNEWLKQDVTAASEWLTTWPDSEARDRAVKNLIFKISKEDPHAALSWAQTIQSGDRYKQTFKIIEQIKQSSPEAADAALRSLTTEDQTVVAALKRAEDVNAQRKAAEKAQGNQE